MGRHPADAYRLLFKRVRIESTSWLIRDLLTLRLRHPAGPFIIGILPLVLPTGAGAVRGDRWGVAWIPSKSKMIEW